MTKMEDDDRFIPLTDQRVFGAGIKRKRIDFVPASTPETSLPASFPPQPTNAGARYLAIVMPQVAKVTDEDKQKKATRQAGHAICTVCKQPLSISSDIPTAGSHESSIAHQVCMEHSYQPSHLDRERVGVKYLAAYGWDVDSRKGLGAKEEGIRIPIKVKEKKDTAGLRETVDEEDVKVKKKVVAKKEERVVKLNTKEIRRRDVQEKHRAERLRQAFYGPDLSQYLGPNS